jgi:malonyl-CoA reductase/3-hydroxypropionate dehydrogenase (NADP+)
MSTMQRHDRLEGKVALITGGAGNIGEVITRRFLAEGATVVITGRNAEKLAAYRRRLIDEEWVAPERVVALRMDGSDIKQVRAGVAQIVHGGVDVPIPLHRIDILVNNAGSAGPRRRLVDIPLEPSEVQPPDTETLAQAVGNLVGIAWNLTRAAAPHMPPGSSVINVSTIFSRTDYYGRIAYVAPKAALNALSDGLARELGTRGIRVNTIYPGPIDSDRIRTMFQAMDALKGQPEGDTASGFLRLMRLGRADQHGEVAKRFPSPIDVANTAVFLASDEAAAFTGHAFEVTHGMDVPIESRTTFVSRPGLRSVDATGKVILICAGDQSDDAIALADALRSCRATVVVGFRDLRALEKASALLREPRHALAADMYGRPTMAAETRLVHLDPLDSRAAAHTLDQIRSELGAIHHAVILPGLSRHAPSASLVDVEDQVIERFLQQELVSTIALARELARFWEEHPSDSQMHRVLFVSNPDDQQGNQYAGILRAAVEQLVRVWRHESEYDALNPAHQRNGKPVAAVWANQLIRYVNNEAANLDFTCAWVAKLLGSDRRIAEINLYLPEEIVGTIGVHNPGFGWAESLFGLHMGKVALITGGSAGIGGQIARLLALSGAHVMLAARNADQLEQMRASIVREVRDASYPDAEARVAIFPGSDVSDIEGLEQLITHTLRVFGKVDYLINNAGIAGAEEMVIDMPVDAWRHTLRANLISNYALLRRLAPQMKAAGGAYVLNVSSYFGGEKYVAIPYPNRSDYAVSKAGQRAMVESLARFLGPEIQINAIAPGPVEGERLKGAGNRPGLFMRRARLILENKRLNEVFAALLASHHEGAMIADLLPDLFANDLHAIAGNPAMPAPLRRLATMLRETSDASGSAQSYLMNATIARKLLSRLENGGYITPHDRRALAVEPPDPFFTEAQIEREAIKVRDGILGMLHLQRMPTEFDVALATVFYLADRNVTGETFHPSGGLRFERTVTEGELFGKPGQQRLERLKGSVVYLIGEHLRQHLLLLARTFLDEIHVARVVLLTETAQAAAELAAELAEYESTGRFVVIPTCGDIEGGIDRAMAEYGRPGPVISTPFRPLPARALSAHNGDWSNVLTTAGFEELVEQQITHHFRVVRKAGLIEGANVTLVTPPTSARSTAEEFALANFVKTTLHALTATAGAESERTMPHVPVNQVDLTRRARSEEPRTPAEEEEELQRFVNAVLLTSAPLPTPLESRYRARIYRGNAITV